METRLKRTVSLCFSTLRQMRRIRRQVAYRPLFSTHWSFRWFSVDLTTVTACWFGYLPLDLMRCLQSVQNAAARKCSLRVPDRIIFSHRALDGSPPTYLSSYFTRVADVPSRSRDCDDPLWAAVILLPHTVAAGGPSQFLPPICGTAFLYTSPQHRRSWFSGISVLILSHSGAPALI